MIVRPVLCRRFIGRSDELAFLEEKRKDAARSHGALVLIAGEAGIGKSRLIAEFCGRLTSSRFRVAAGACLEHAQRPYGPILDVLERIEPGAVAILSPAASKREQLDELFARFTRAAEKNGVIAVIEDLHWADTATLEFLTVLAPRLEKMRMLVLASFRSSELPADHPLHAALVRLERAARSSRIDLAALEGNELRHFIDEALGAHRLSDETRRAVVGASDGNPFFVEELLKVAVERAELAPASSPRGGVSSALPMSVRSTLLERWRGLEPADRDILAQAAVIGRTFDIALLARTLDLDLERVFAALQRARDVQLVDEIDAMFRFRHALTRDAIYSAFLRAQLTALHRKIAIALEATPAEPGALEALAYHWWAAGDDVNMARYNREAGDAAASVHAHEDALEFYRRALESKALAPAERGAILEKLADRHLALSASERGFKAIDEAVEQYHLAADYDNEVRCLARATMQAYQLHLLDPQSRLIAMLDRLDASEYIARSRVHLGIAWIDASRGFPTDAAAHLAAVDPRALEERLDIANRYHNVAAWVAMTMNELETFESEHAAWVSSAAASPSSALASAHINGAFCYAQFGEHEKAREHVELALGIARSGRNVLLEESSYAFAATCAYFRGDLAAVRDALAHVSPTTDSAVNLCHAAASGTLAGLHVGDDEFARRWYDGIGDDRLGEVEELCGAGFAELLARRGRPDDAAYVLSRTIPDCERLRGNVFTNLAAARLGAPPEMARARAQLERAATAPRESIERFALDLFEVYAARREGRDDATVVDLARRAADGFARLRFPLLAAAAYEAAGDVDQAVAAYEACGAIGDLKRLRRSVDGPPRALAARGLPSAGTGAATAPRSLLSERETEVAALVARGASNREIADTLNIAVKTVEKNLASIYRKLGISSRARLAVYVITESASA